MNAHTRSQERREILSVARRYRRDGYKVSGPDKWSSKPGFLGDAVPDLIAERDDDKVVVEVKRAASVRGANDIVELAERVSTQPGWRFELIAIPENDRIARPDLDWIDADVRLLAKSDLNKPAFIMAYAAIENLIAFAAARNNRNPASTTFPSIVRDLVVRGVIDEDLKRVIDDALARRNAIMHARDEPAPTLDDVEALVTLGRDLEREILASSDRSDGGF